MSADNLSLRGLGSVGIVSDVGPYDLPAPALSGGVNIRFDRAKVSRAPVPRRIYQFAGAQTSHAPGLMFSIPPVTTGAESLITVAKDFSKIYSVVGSTISDVTHPTAAANDTSEPFTTAVLGSVAYLNRRSRVPVKMAQSDSTFVDLPNWDSTHRCGVLRSFKDFLVAFNMAKGAGQYPTMVKWSDTTTYGIPPATWVPLTTNLAGENTLTNMRGRIIDALQLQDSFIIYGENEVWQMSYVGGTFVFDFRKRFDDVGILNTNCCIEVDGQHYVFDNFDLYTHDGTSKQSIAQGRVKEFVFGGLIKDLKSLAFVAHNPKLNEVMFCYPSNDRYAAYTPTTGCNRAAVYNYRNNTWTYYDLPNVTSATLATLTTGLTWSSEATSTWSTLGGTWNGSTDSQARHIMFSSPSDDSAGLTASRLYGFDLIEGGQMAKPVETEALRPVQGERIGIDLDDNGTPIRAYKCLLSIYPQVSLTADGTNLQFSFGANDVVGQSPVWDSYQSFSPATMDKLDTRVAGRYLAYRFKLSGPGDFGLSGLDANISVRGMRG